MLLKCLLWCAFMVFAVTRAGELENCKNSKIEENVTLKGGIGAGTFRKMGRVTSMDSCIELCCKTHTCDVAFLSGAKCYGVECVSHDECQSTPTDTSDIKVLISHVRTDAKKENTSLPFALPHVGPATHPDPVINMLGNPNLNKVGATKAATPQLADKSSNILAVKVASISPPVVDKNSVPGLTPANPLQGLIAGKPALNSGTNPALPGVSSLDSAAVAAGANAAVVKSNVASASKGDSSGGTPGTPGSCKPGKIYKEVTLLGGINAGTYKDIGAVKDVNECSSKCCEFSACDVALMLQNRCYLVGCSDGKNCQMQKAKPSAFHPTIVYVTRWNSEGVKHTVHMDEQDSSKAICNPMKVLTKVTLKGGLKAGDFTDIGKVGTMGECYSSCCKQPTCNLAFMLGQNCFSVKCYNKVLCGIMKAQPSIFNPQIAYVVNRKLIPATPKSTITQCPVGKTIEKVTLVGGIQAGNFRDHGKVKDMAQCRRICCEMPKCNLAFILAGNCFSVECKNIELCKTQPSKPSKFAPQISYVRAFGSTNFLDTKPTAITEPIASPVQKSETPQVPVKAKIPVPGQGGQGLNPAMAPAGKPSKPAMQTTTKTLQNLLNDANTAIHGQIPTKSKPALVQQPGLQVPPAVSQLGQQLPPGLPGQPLVPSPLPKMPQQQLVNPRPQSNLKLSFPSSNSLQAPLLPLSSPKSAEIGNIVSSNVSDVGGLPIMQQGLQENKTIDLEKQLSAASAGQAMSLNLVNGRLELTSVTSANKTTGKETEGNGGSTKGSNKEASSAFDSIFGEKTPNKEKCNIGDVIKDVTLKGGKSSGKFDDKGDVASMDECTDLCCKDKSCNVAFMLGKTCYTVACKSKELCEHSSAPPSNFKPRLVYVRPLKSKQDELPGIPPAPKDLKCKHQNITNNKKLQGTKDKSNFTLVEDVDSMGDCMKECCDSKSCDLAYYVSSKCYLVKCSDKVACSLVKVKPSKDSPLIAKMIKAEKEQNTDLESKVNYQEQASIPETTMFDMHRSKGCKNSNIVYSTALQSGTSATNFTSLGRVANIQTCIGMCCGRPLCDIAYMKDDKCYAVRCLDGMFCQTGSRPVSQGMNVRLAYMNRGGPEKDKDWMIIYIIIGSLAVASGIGGILWAACICAKRQKLRQKRRLLDDEEDDEMLPKPTQTRYRTPMPRY